MISITGSHVDMPDDANWLVVRGLQKKFGRQLVLSDFDLALGRGEIVSLLGPSGVGKSTLIKILLGLVPADAGSIYLAGRDISRLPVAARNIGVVYQNYSLFEHLTVRENVAFPLRARKARGTLDVFIGLLRLGGDREITRAVDFALQTVNMSKNASKRPRQLSGGEQQRVALARALVMDPELLCMDEPLAALDLELRGALLTEIRRLHDQRQTTMLFVTHNVSEAFAIGNRVGVLQSGKIAQIGAPRDVYNHPITEFVGRATGELNVLPVARTKQVDGLTICELAGGGEIAVAKQQVPPGARIGIRPERLSLASSTRTMPRHSVPATLVRSSFLGQGIHLDFQTKPGNLPLSVVVPNSQTEAPSALALPLGGAADLTYDSADWLVFSPNSVV